jgi:hypothetical protein
LGNRIPELAKRCQKNLRKGRRGGKALGPLFGFPEGRVELEVEAVVLKRKISSSGIPNLQFTPLCPWHLSKILLIVTNIAA